MAARHHFEQSLFTGEQGFSPLPVVDISVQEVPQDDAAFRITQGKAARVKPPVHPVRAAEAGLKVVWLAGFDCLPPRGEDIWAGIRMKAVADRAKMTLALRRPKPPRRMQGFLCPPSVLDIGANSAPFDDQSGCVD